jgi:hypothetical protein
MEKNFKNIENSFFKDEINAIREVLKMLRYNRDDIEIQFMNEVKWNDEVIKIPYRIYFEELGLSEFNDLYPDEKSVYMKLYTRHYDGHVRMKMVANLVKEKIPNSEVYIFTCFSDYVVEIPIIANALIDQDLQRGIKKISLNNPVYSKLIKSRLISYWACYYRYKYPIFTQYPGYALINKCEAWNDGEIRNLIRKSKKIEQRMNSRKTNS